MPYTIPPNLQKMLDDLQALRSEQEEYEAELLQLESRQYALQGRIAALKTPQLKAEMEANNKKITELQERKRYYEIQLKVCEKQMREYVRKQRNRRIFTRGGMLETFLLEPLLLSDDEVHEFLQSVFRMPEVDSLLRKLLDDARTIAQEESEKDVENEEN